MSLVLCLASFVLTDSPLKENNEELITKHWRLYLHSSFMFFQDYAVKAETDLELLPFVLGGPK